MWLITCCDRGKDVLPNTYAYTCPRAHMLQLICYTPSSTLKSAKTYRTAPIYIAIVTLHGFDCGNEFLLIIRCTHS